ncbi:MAG: aminoacyl-tRNA hydrolase [Bacteroidales bacterium]|nr:aminoacyl-tRNA hydrolase [Bacteroidales bacterium]
MKFLIVGLGNIGDEYAHTRHNTGFDIVSRLASDAGAAFSTERYGDVARMRVKGRDLVLLKPNTYMNLSGKAVRYWADKENVPCENIVVVVDDLALPVGAIRLKGKGSPGGHNGLKNISELLGTDGYPRLRFGIGNEFHRGGQIDFVLGKWSDEEKTVVDERMELAAECIRTFVCIGLQLTMTQFNNK